MEGCRRRTKRAQADLWPKSDLGRRRTDYQRAAIDCHRTDRSDDRKEPVTIVYSEKGWIRAAKGHLEDISTLKFKEGDQLKFWLHAETTDKLIIFGTNGRFYTVGVDKLPGGRGHGEPIRLMVDIPNGHDVVKMMKHEGGRRFLIASDAGRGFIVPEDEVVAQTKNGKQILNVDRVTSNGDQCCSGQRGPRRSYRCQP